MVFVCGHRAHWNPDRREAPAAATRIGLDRLIGDPQMRFMAHRTRILALTALSVLSPLGVDAQSGVLIGVAKPGGYETLWIVRDPARSVHATIPALLVPRADGWWRVGTVPICSTEEVEGQAMDVLWRTRADSTPVIAEICHEVAASDLPYARATAEDTAGADSLQTMVRCSWSHISIKFVSAEYMAVGRRVADGSLRAARRTMVSVLLRLAFQATRHSALTLDAIADSLGPWRSRAGRPRSRRTRCAPGVGASMPAS